LVIISRRKGQQFEFGHDDIGNRKSASKGGDQNGNNLRTSTYTANNLNHYTARTTPGFAEVVGLANPAGTVTVNGSSAGVYRRGEYFRRELTVGNSGGPIRESVTVGASFGGQNATPETGGIYLPRSSEITSHITYDPDGNLTGDSLWTYVWDGENRLIELAMKAGTGISGSTRLRLLFDYDFQGRRIQKRVFTHNGTGWTQDTAKTRKFVYDGWNLIAELDGSNNRVRTYVWGLDLSGTMQGAGGVGGLLVVSQHTPSVSHHFVAYDGNGNVTGLINAADGKYSARYEYGPFGEPVRVNGGMGRNNPFRFSTKFTDDESGLLYYGYRFYDPSSGRWPSRDPIGELGGVNLYAYLGNDAVVSIDFLGLLQVNVNGPSANQTDPSIHPGGESYTTFHPRRFLFFPVKLVKCKCEKQQGSCVYRVKCEIRYTARIRLSRGQANTFGVPLDGIYGHEQMHSLSINHRVENEVANPLRAEQEDFPLRRDCKTSAKNYERDYIQRLRNVLWDGSSDHSDDPTSPLTPYSPTNATPYPPQPGSLPVR
jgi:RHS repeat-associated protein